MRKEERKDNSSLVQKKEKFSIENDSMQDALNLINAIVIYMRKATIPNGTYTQNETHQIPNKNDTFTWNPKCITEGAAVNSVYTYISLTQRKLEQKNQLATDLDSKFAYSHSRQTRKRDEEMTTKTEKKLQNIHIHTIFHNTQLGAYQKWIANIYRSNNSAWQKHARARICTPLFMSIEQMDRVKEREGERVRCRNIERTRTRL